MNNVKEMRYNEIIVFNETPKHLFCHYKLQEVLYKQSSTNEAAIIGFESSISHIPRVLYKIVLLRVSLWNDVNPQSLKQIKMLNRFTE